MSGDDPTRYIHAGDRLHREKSATSPLAPPIYQTTVYAFDDTHMIDAVHDGDEPGYIYGRYGLPNAGALEEAIASLESAESGLATTSATSGILATLLSLTATGDRIVAGHNTYGGTRALLDNELARFNVTTDYVNLTDHQAVQHALSADPPPAVLWADSLSNPTLITHDIPALLAMARERGVPAIVDNTFPTPFHFNPIPHGADLVIHSGTKFIGGHNDVSSGVIVGASEMIHRVRRTAIRTGAIIGPFDAWLSLRGLRSMEVRLRRSSETALALAQSLEGHPRIHRVHYPGLESDPQHELARRLFRNGYGSIVSVDFGDEATLREVADRLEMIQIAETLGGVMTTVVLPKLNYYRHLTASELAAIGISPGLARFSIGLESPDDLIADVLSALNGA